MASFTSAGGGGIPATVVVPGLNTPVITTLSLPAADTEYSYTFTLGIKRFRLRIRGASSQMRLSYTSGGEHYTVYRGEEYAEDGIDTSVPLTIYLQVTQAAQVLEILTWA